ncbi:MAG: DNA polymerase III subunit beta [Acidaminococcales bacterium]|jgi:DNA polymerase-3 subunit beta|nr:DNA polymerase III subunit beta [Acidaminococcales bacterium]
MKIICQAQKLGKAAQILQKALPSKAVSSQVYMCVYLKAFENKIEMQATDSVFGVSVTLDAQVVEEGEAVIAGALFTSVVEKVEREYVEIYKNEEESKVVISSGEDREAVIFCLPAEDYPVINKLSVTSFIKIKDDILKEMIRKTVFACSSEKEMRAIFTGVLVEIKGRELVFAATNTHRLVVKRYELESEQGEFSMVIPSGILREIESINLGELPEDVIVGWKNHQIILRFGDVYMESRLIEGSFPDYRKVIPASFGKKARVKTADLLGAVSRAAPFSKEGENNVLKLSIDNGRMVISASNPEKGKSTEKISCENEGGPIEIAFNMKYISDILRRIESEYTVVSLNSSVSPAQVAAEGDDNYLYIMTPIRLGT